MNEQQVFEAVFKATGVNNFEKAIAGAQDSIKSFENASKKIRDTGATLTKAVTLPILGIGIASGKVAADFETAMTGVAKTTDLTGQEFSNMEDAILEMTRVIPASATEIAGVAEAAGQLGIEKENILDFTETMVNLGVATNISAEEAATSLARLANITGMPQTEFDKLGSVIVELGNNLATTEGEIVDMGLRLAGTASQVGLTEAEIMALAGAMSSVGISAEAGGTAMSQVMQKINTAVKSGSDEMVGFAEISGLSQEEFMEAWATDPQEAITSFVTGLGRLNDEGVDTNTMLAELGISGLREVDTLNRLSGASGLMVESFDMANVAWEENTALTDEAQIAYETTANKIQLAKNAISEAAITISGVFLPIVAKAAEKVAEWSLKFADLDDETKKIILVVGGLVAAIGPVLLVISKLITTVVAVTKAFAAVKVAVAAGGAAVAALSAPVLIAIGVITALIAIGVALYKNWDTVKAKAGQLRDTISSVFSRISSAISTAASAISGAINRIKSFFTSMGSSGSSLSTSISGSWNRMTSAISSAVGRISGFVSNVRSSFNSLKNISLVSAGRSIMSGFTRGLKSAWGAGKKFIGGIGGWIAKNKGPISYDKKLLINAGEAIIGGLNKGLQDSFPGVQKTVKGIAGAINETMTGGPTVDISGSVAKSNAGVSRVISHELNNNMSTQPAYINLNIGGRVFKAFVDDITNVQDNNQDLELSYS